MKNKIVPIIAKLAINTSDKINTIPVPLFPTEYNNLLFIQNMCQQLGMDKNDMFSFFLDLRDKHSIDEIYIKFNNENYNIAKLDINRIYRFLDKYALEEED